MDNEKDSRKKKRKRVDRMEGGREKLERRTGKGDVYIDFLDSAKRFRDRNYGNERP